MQPMNAIGRRRMVHLSTGVTVAALAGCLGDDGDDGAADRMGDSDTDDDDGDDGDGDSESVALRSEELETAIETLEAPEPGTGTLVHDDGREFDLEVRNWVPGEDPDEACVSDENDFVRAVGEYQGERYEDGGYIRVFLQTGYDSDDDLYNNLILYVEEEPDGDVHQMGRQVYNVPEEPGDDGDHSAAVEVVDGTWYAGARVASFSDEEEPEPLWIAVTCE